METRANYALIGAFTMAVILAAFGFVFWFSGPSKTTARRDFDVIFTGSVAGLSRGGAVTFNGLRVGDVASLHLDPDNPSQVIAHIQIDKRMPVKADTRARLEFSGLTGVASLALSGGNSAAPDLEAAAGQNYPTLRAEVSQFQNLLETAQRIGEQLGAMSDKVNKLLDQNSESIGKTVANVEKMTGSLADQYDGVGPLMMSLNKSSAKLDQALDNVNGILGSAGGDAKKALTDVGDAARSIKKLADDLDGRMKEITTNIARFSGSGLRQYEALAIDGRKTLDDISRAVRSLEKDPSQIIFGGKPQLPEYKAR
jgi:phospholipid/cholesterol/gamma-HCH transport system substrate-binding protein